MEMKRLAGFFVNHNMYFDGKFRFHVDAVTKIPHTKLCVVSGGKDDAVIVTKEDLLNHCYDKKNIIVQTMDERGWPKRAILVDFR